MAEWRYTIALAMGLSLISAAVFMFVIAYFRNLTEEAFVILRVASVVMAITAMVLIAYYWSRES